MKRQSILLLALAAALVAPASASAAPSVTVTNDAGQPAALSAAAPLGIRNMDVTVAIAIPASDSGNYRAQILAPDNSELVSLSSCLNPGDETSASPGYRGNGAYTVVFRAFAGSDTSCTGNFADRRVQYVVNGSSGVTPPPTRVLTRRPNSFVTNTYNLGIALNPGAISYEIRYARNGAIGPDGGISGASTPAFVDTSSGLAPFRFDKPGRYVAVARAGRGGFFSPWSGAAVINAVAPFDLERVTFPDSRGPTYKLRGTVRERSARGSRVTIFIARKWKGGKYRRLGRAKVNSKGRFTKRFRQSGYGKHRLRYTFKGNKLVARGRVTQKVTIRKRFFFN